MYSKTQLPRNPEDLNPNTRRSHMRRGYCAWPYSINDGRGSHSLYKSWINIKSMCYGRHSNRSGYKEIGIRMCGRWYVDFWQFVADMGERPEGCTLVRRNRFSNYSPENCLWQKGSTSHFRKFVRPGSKPKKLPPVKKVVRKTLPPSQPRIEETKKIVVDNRTKHPLYNTWNSLKKGKPGLCPEWHNDFWSFIRGVGPRPPRASLRSKNRKGYMSPTNFRWVRRVQSNIPHNKIINGKKYSDFFTHDDRSWEVINLKEEN